MNTTGWTTNELHRIGGATELRVASYRPHGTLRPYVTIWTVATDDAIYVRSAYGPDDPWFRRALAGGRAASGPAGSNATSSSSTWTRHM
ncbi:DUF2255 family protein [Nonomuraea sp. M3C6]|uniref:DUF2255 family protein n=1 Tax=Nonomuraea marmarensis TaxID=3351344 RepID=A0ABW7AWF8_9ACTN